MGGHFVRGRGTRNIELITHGLSTVYTKYHITEISQHGMFSLDYNGYEI